MTEYALHFTGFIFCGFTIFTDFMLVNSKILELMVLKYSQVMYSRMCRVVSCSAICTGALVIVSLPVSISPYAHYFCAMYAGCWQSLPSDARDCHACHWRFFSHPCKAVTTFCSAAHAAVLCSHLPFERGMTLP